MAEQQDEIVELRDVKARLIRQNTALSEKYDQDTARLKVQVQFAVPPPCVAATVLRSAHHRAILRAS